MMTNPDSRRFYPVPKQKASYGTTHRIRIAVAATVLMLSCYSELAAQGVANDTLLALQLKNSEQVMRRDAKALTYWWWGWFSGYTAATAVQGIAGVSSGSLPVRQDMYLGAATALAGAVGQLLWPVKPSLVRSYRDASTASTLAITDIHGEQLKALALAESKGRSWQMHAASTAVNLGSGLVTWIGFRRTFKDGLVNFAINTAITEAQIWSQPVRVKNYYQKSHQSLTAAGIFEKTKKPRFLLSADPAAGGVRMVVRF